MSDEGEWVKKGSDFEEYENKVERFIAALEGAIEELHGSGHLDDAGYLRLLQLAGDF